MTLGQGIEQGEEIVVQVGNNIFDKFNFDSRIGVFDGLNSADFYVQNTITGLAIQGPNLGKTTYSIFSHEFKTQREVAKDKELITKIDNIDKEYAGLELKKPKSSRNKKQL